ncbi:hypothetical protein TNCV_1089981 [Trichonephila clavipes]|uniref:Endonuclease/exonuclease/phosphatase domain-containing protein n=1 Tax=Trichonephila clavipes TaxID=2585209 RepID=A0A8X6SNV2_TRICX|nr:hypothetical protein TNCV_1089981 [Trichonephila clavipes]
MTSSDSLEAIELRVWKRNIGYRVSFLYNPPRNKPDLNSLLHDWNKHSFILGDFNAPSTRWGYVQNCTVGYLVEDFIENSTASSTFLSYRGASSHPDLLLAHPNLTPFVYHHLVQAPGGDGHKILSVIISNPGETHAPRVTRWNLKKANWEKYASLTNTLLENFDYRKDGSKAFRLISALNGKQTQPCKQPMKVGGKILTSDLDIAKIFLKYYHKVSNFRPRRQIRKREINSPPVNQKWDRLFSAPFSDEEF